MARHLTLEEREVISQMWFAGHSRRQIADALRRHRTTIGRELQRNGGSNGYRAVAAQRQAETRRSMRPRVKKMDRPDVYAYVTSALEKYWSPDQIAGYARKHLKENLRLSHQTIYNWLQSHDHARRWRRCLRSSGWHPRPRREKTLPASVSVDRRPAIVDRRARYGDWEGDTIVGPRRSPGALVSLVERKSGYLLLKKLKERKAAAVRRAVCRSLRSLPGRLRRTVTFDNGKEFAEHTSIARDLKLKVYFAKPYAAWQRGTNENTNGLVRQFFPKGTPTEWLTQCDIVRIQTLINERPRKRLGYQTPTKVLKRHGCN
jgi:IS30 family transposase